MRHRAAPHEEFFSRDSRQWRSNGVGRWAKSRAPECRAPECRGPRVQGPPSAGSPSAGAPEFQAKTTVHADETFNRFADFGL